MSEPGAVSFHGVPIAAPANVECHSAGCNTAQRCETAEELLAFMVDHRERHHGLHLNITPTTSHSSESDLLMTQHAEDGEQGEPMGLADRIAAGKVPWRITLTRNLREVRLITAEPVIVLDAEGAMRLVAAVKGAFPDHQPVTDVVDD